MAYLESCGLVVVSVPLPLPQDPLQVSLSPLIGPKVCRVLASLPPSLPRLVVTYLFSLLGLGLSSQWAPLTPFLNSRDPGESLSHLDPLALPPIPTQMWGLSDMMR